MNVRRGREGEYNYGDQLPMIGGAADGMYHAWDLEGDEPEKLRAELAEKLARKRPPGFAPWPEDTPTEGA